MRVNIKGKDIALNKEEVQSAKRIIITFLNNIEKKSEDAGLRTFYFTCLIVMYLISMESLDYIDEKSLALIMNTLNKSE